MQMIFENTCIVCHAEKLIFRKKQIIWGMVAPENYFCEQCGATFMEDELRWKLVSTKDKAHPIWQEFRHKSLYVREWLAIGHMEPVLSDAPIDAGVGIY